MNLSPQGTILYEENNIRYQVYSDKYYESTLESIILSRISVSKGNVYSDFSIDKESIIKDSIKCLKEAVLTIIAIDISKETPIVVSQMLGTDLTTFISDCNKNSTSNNKFNMIDQRLIQPLKEMQYKYGEVLMGTSYGVRKQYQNLNIGNNLGMLYFGACLGSSYKMYCGRIYNSKVLNTVLQLGPQLISQVKVEDCISIDENIANQMKSSFSLVAFVDKRKDVSGLQLPSNIFMRPSL